MPVFTSIGVALGVSATLWGGAAALGTGLAVAGAAAYGVTSLATSGGSKQKQLTNQMPNAPQAPKLEDASKQAQLRAEDRKRNMARSKSVMTNPLGLKDEANVARKKLLGG